MSLLDDVSIVVTPNAYKAGTLYGVLPVPIEGSELINCGNFSCADPNAEWTRGTGWTISGGTANCDGSQTTTTNLHNAVSNGLINNVKYIVTYTISNYSAGSIRIKLGNSGFGADNSANGTYTETITAIVSTFPTAQFNADSSFDGSVDNVSVKQFTASDMDVTRATAATRVDENGLVNYAEVLGGEEITNGDFATDSDWTKGVGWTISGGSANYSDGAKFSQLKQILTNDNTSNYKLTFDTVINSGQFRIKFGSNNYDTITTTGTYTIYGIFSAINTNITFEDYDDISSNFTIDNVSVKEADRNNVPRIDYTGGGCPHILAEPQRTNTETKSNEFSTWGLTSNNTPTANYTVSPDGTQNATRLQFTANGFRANTTLLSSVVYTLSCFAKRNDSGTQSVGFFKDGSGTVDSAWSLTSDWVRFTYTYTTTNASYAGIAGLSGADVSVFGFQAEQGAYATSYIPTSGSTVTRNQDLFTRDGIGSLINSTEGVLFVDIAALSDDGTYRLISISDGTNNNRVTLGFSNSNNKFYFQLKASSNNIFAEQITETHLNSNKIAFKYKSGELCVYINGAKVIDRTDTFTFNSNLNDLSFFEQTTINPFFGKVKQLQVYKTALTDAQLTSLTS